VHPATKVSWLIWGDQLVTAGGGARWYWRCHRRRPSLLASGKAGLGLSAGRVVRRPAGRSRLLIWPEHYLRRGRHRCRGCPPSCFAVDCRPGSHPGQLDRGVADDDSVAPTITGGQARPSSTNTTMVHWAGNTGGGSSPTGRTGPPGTANPSVTIGSAAQLADQCPGERAPTNEHGRSSAAGGPRRRWSRPCTFSR